MNAPLLRCRGLEAGYGASRVLFGLDFDIRAGDQLRMKAHKVLVFTSLDTHQPIPAPDDVRHAIETRFLKLS